MRLKVIDYDVMRVAFDEKFKQTYQLIQNGETHLDNLAEGFHEADGVIFALPTIETEPVRHGRWIDAEDDGGGTLWHCSKCRKPVKTFCLPPNYDYCPHCGADMRDIPTKSLSPEGQKLYDTLLTRVKMDGGADNEN